MTIANSLSIKGNNAKNERKINFSLLLINLDYNCHVANNYLSHACLTPSQILDPIISKSLGGKVVWRKKEQEKRNNG